MRMLDPVTCACSTPSHAEGVGRVPRERISRFQPGQRPFSYWVSTRLVTRARPVSHSGTRRGAGYKPCSILQNNGRARSQNNGRGRSPLRPAWDNGHGDRENGKKECCVLGLVYYRGVERRIAPLPKTILHGGGGSGRVVPRTDGILMPMRNDSRAHEKKFSWA